MKRPGWYRTLIGAFFFAAWSHACCQAPDAGEFLLQKALGLLSGARPAPLRFRADQSLDYSLSGSFQFLRNPAEKHDFTQVSLQHRVKVRSDMRVRKEVHFVCTFTHDLGLQYLFDSLFLFNPDDNAFETRMDAAIGSKLSLTFSSRINTRLFNSYSDGPGKGGSHSRVLSGSFLTPLIWTFSSGIGWTLNRAGILSVGLSSGKYTWIRDRSVYDQAGINEFSGVSKQERGRFEYGLSLQFLADRDLAPGLHWNCDLRLFKNFRKPVDFEVDNLIGIRIGRLFKTDLRTKISYDESISRRVRFENRITIGIAVIK